MSVQAAPAALAHCTCVFTELRLSSLTRKEGERGRDSSSVQSATFLVTPFLLLSLLLGRCLYGCELAARLSKEKMEMRTPVTSNEQEQVRDTRRKGRESEKKHH